MVCLLLAYRFSASDPGSGAKSSGWVRILVMTLTSLTNRTVSLHPGDGRDGFCDWFSLLHTLYLTAYSLFIRTPKGAEMVLRNETNGPVTRSNSVWAPLALLSDWFVCFLRSLNVWRHTKWVFFLWELGEKGTANKSRFKTRSSEIILPLLKV